MPSTVPACVIELLSIRAMPKSAIFAWPCAGQHDVGRLDVAMHHAALVAELQPGQQVLHDPQRVGEREPLLLVQQRLQRRPVDELHDDVGEVIGLAVVEHADDVGMGQPAGRLRLAAEAGQRFLRLRIVRAIRQPDRLDRHAAGDDRVPALVDGAHGAAAERALDLVLAEQLDGLVCHGLAGGYRPASLLRRNVLLGAYTRALAAFADHRERRPEERMGDFRRQPLAGIRQHRQLRVAQGAGDAEAGASRIRRSVSATRNAAT